MRAKGIVASDDEMCSELSFVLMKQFGDQCNVCCHTCLPSTVQSLQFEVGCHEQIDKLSISSSACTACVDVWSHIVYFFTILFDNNRSACGSGISSNDNSVLNKIYDTLNLRPTMVVPVFLNGCFWIVLLASMILFRWAYSKLKPPSS